MSDNRTNQWWPINPYPHPMRSADVTYAAIGPSLTNQIVRLFDEFKQSGAEFNEEIEMFFEELRSCDGRPPEMLHLMAASVAAVSERLWPGGAFDGIASELVQNSTLMNEAFKLFGSFVVDAAQTFDMSPSDLLEYITTQREFYGESVWPPRNRYYTQEPSGNDVVQFRSSDGESTQDLLAFWLSLRSYPSLVGAHLVDISDLERYRDELRRGLANLEDDLQLIDKDERVDAKRDLIDAVDMVSDAVRLIRQAQEMFVHRFST